MQLFPFKHLTPCPFFNLFPSPGSQGFDSASEAHPRTQHLQPAELLHKQVRLQHRSLPSVQATGGSGAGRSQNQISCPKSVRRMCNAPSYVLYNSHINLSLSFLTFSYKILDWPFKLFLSRSIMAAVNDMAHQLVPLSSSPKLNGTHMTWTKICRHHVMTSSSHTNLWPCIVFYVLYWSNVTLW